MLNPSVLTSGKIILAFVAVFLTGTLVGGLIAMNFSDQRFSKFLSRSNDPAAMATRIDDKLKAEFQLNPDQQQKIKPLSRDMAEHLYQLRKQFGSDVLSTLEDFHNKVGEQLSPEQRADYQKLNEDRMKRARGMLLPDSLSTESGK